LNCRRLSRLKRQARCYAVAVVRLMPRSRRCCKPLRAVLNFCRNDDDRHELTRLESNRGKQQKSKNRSHGLPEPQRIPLNNRSPPWLPGCRVQRAVLEREDEFDRVCETVCGLCRDHSHEDMIEPRRKVRPAVLNGNGRPRALLSRSTRAICAPAGAQVLKNVPTLRPFVIFTLR
jgi:hypothetical protein